MSRLDYSNKDYWLKLPQKNNKKVDVFYLYPTAWNRRDESEPEYAQIFHQGMRKNAQRVFASHSLVFADTCNLYAPYYRQTSADFGIDHKGSLVEIIGDTYAGMDAIDSFDYYIKNLNNGRPFFLAGHSQGSTILQVLLRDYMRENPQVLDRMVAAYVIGYAVTKKYMKENPHLKFAEGETDTGVIISFNTQGDMFFGDAPMVLDDSIVINPINWRRDELMAGPNLNLGEIVYEDGKVKTKVPGTKDAVVNKERGTLVCTTANAESHKHKWFPLGVYHSYDYEFYYGNLKKNVKDRAEAFFKKSAGKSK